MADHTCKQCGAAIEAGQPDGGMDERLCLRCWREDGSTAHQTTPKPRLHFAYAKGETAQEMREAVRGTDLYNMGDAKLVWVNEGDLWALQMTGAAVVQDMSHD